MKGVFKELPLVSILLLVSMLGITGLPFSSGSFSKYLILYDVHNTFLNIFINTVNIGTIIIMFRIALILFGESNNKEENVVTSNRRWVLGAMLLLFTVVSIFSTDIYSYIFKNDISLDMAKYLPKALVFFGGILLAFILYKLKFYESKVFDAIRKVDLGFNMIALCIPLFNAALFIYLIMTNT